MPGAFVPPAGLVEGLGRYAYMTASDRQAEYNRLYQEWLGAGYATVHVFSPVTTATEPFQGLNPDTALLDQYAPGWRSTPTLYQTPTQLAALTAQAKRSQTEAAQPKGKGATSSGNQAWELGDGYRMYYDPTLKTYTVTKDTYTGDSVNGVPVGSNFTLTTVSAAQAQGLIALLGGERNAWRDYHLQGWSQGHGGGQQGTGPLTEAQIQAAIAPAATTTPPTTTTPNPLTAPVAPHLMASLANPPTKAGESTPEMLASRAAQDTVREIAAEMAAKQRTSEEATLLGSPMLSGYKPIRLRPRT